MDALAVILERPERLALKRLSLTAAGAGDAVVEVAWSGISTGTERLLWSGRMPDFPAWATRWSPATRRSAGWSRPPPVRA